MRRPRAPLVFTFVLVCLGWFSAVARADDGRPDARARPLFEAGREAYQAGRYREAAEAFERVFALTAHPFMLRNLGNCYARLGERDKAKAALREYLKLAPDAEDRAEVEAMLASLEREAEPPPAPEAVALTEAPPPEPPPAPAAAAAPRAEAPSHGLLLGRTFTWIALGASAALGTTTAVLWSGANSDYAKLERSCGAHGGCSERQISGVSHAVTAANLTLGLSLAALASSAVLFFVEGAHDDVKEALALTPSVGIHELRLSLSGQL